MSTYIKFKRAVLDDYLEIDLTAQQLVVSPQVAQPGWPNVVTPFDPSPDGTTVPPASRIVDTAGGVWTLRDGVVYLGQWQAGNGAGYKIAKSAGQIFVLGVDRLHWWQWMGNGQYQDSGTTPPAGVNDAVLPNQIDFDWKFIDFINPKRNVQLWITTVTGPPPVLVPGVGGYGFVWRNVFPEGLYPGPGGRDYGGGSIWLYLEPGGRYPITVDYTKQVPDASGIMHDVVIGTKTKTVIVPVT